ncbi:MAG: carbohydrate ABC transporter permease [Actinobacteria bacterium]|nr:carbohydrate ABC transporter permease [Actinomycetota bacterium]
MASQAAAARRPGGEKPTRRRSRAWLAYAALLVLTIVYVAPFLWMVITSFKTNAGSTAAVPTWIPNPFSTEGYETILDPVSAQPVFRWFINSLLAATVHMLLVVVTASMAAYALARLEFPGKRIMFAVIIATLFIPTIIFLIPNYLIVDSFGWIDSLPAVIVPSAAGAFGVFFMRQFFITLPVELEEAALLDGANHWDIFTKIVLPLSKPALATLAVLSFLTNWNDFLWPVFVLVEQAVTLPPGLARLQSAYTTNYAAVMAGAVITSLPVLVLFTAAQRYVVEGVARTGLKG